MNDNELLEMTLGIEIEWLVSRRFKVIDDIKTLKDENTITNLKAELVKIDNRLTEIINK